MSDRYPTDPRDPGAEVSSYANVHRMYWDSIGAMWDDTRDGETARVAYMSKHGREPYGDWVGNVGSAANMAALARDGDRTDLDRIIAVAGDAVRDVRRDVELPEYRTVHDVSGGAVDIAAFLAGEPENMIRRERTMRVKDHPVITLCASVAASGSQEPETLRKRGQTVVALAYALTTLGRSVELYVDHTSVAATDPGLVLSRRVRLKGPNDTLDIAKIMFAYAHPAMLRVLSFAAMWSAPQPWRRAMVASACPGRVIHDLPEGTLYLPGIRSARDIPTPDAFITDTLRTLGIIPPLAA